MLLCACAESPTNNSVSATLFTISNFNSNNSYFTSSSLAINVYMINNQIIL